MKKLFFIILCLISTFQISSAQHIETRKTTLGGYIYTLNGEKLKLKQMVSLMESNLDAHSLMVSAKRQKGASDILGFVGGFLVGYNLGESLFGEKFDWVSGGIGIGLIAASLPFYYSFIRKTTQAIDMYNSSIDDVKIGYRPVRLDVGTSAHGIGLTLSF